MKNKRNIFETLPGEKLTDEWIETLQEEKNIKIKRIISTGQITPEGQWYDQLENEWVVLLRGSAKLFIEGKEEVTLTAGDYIFIPAHQRHRVVWTDPEDVCVWLAFFY